MDFERKPSKRLRWLKMAIIVCMLLVLVGGANLAVRRLANNEPTIDSRSVVVATVEHGEMVHEVRGVGQLEAEKVSWIPAQTAGRIAEILVLPGTDVLESTLILRMTSPDLQLAYEEARSAVASARAELRSQRASLANEALKLESDLVRLEANFNEAKAIHDVAVVLFGKDAEHELNVQLKRIRVEGQKQQYAVAKSTLRVFQDSRADQLAVYEEKVTQAIAKRDREQARVDSLLFKAGFNGVLAQSPVEVGQQVDAGEVLAKVVDPRQLKAKLRIAEVQARYIRRGQKATIDTYNGLVPGHVTRIYPEVEFGSVAIDVAFDAELPDDARPDLSVLGMVEIQRLHDVVFVARPVSGMANSTIELFRVDPESKASIRVPVDTGIASVNQLEIKHGLVAGDRVIVSDMSRFDELTKVRLE